MPAFTLSAPQKQAEEAMTPSHKKMFILDISPQTADPFLDQRNATNKEFSMSGNIVIIGAQWGDEGKGKIVDLAFWRILPPWYAFKAE